MKYAKINIHTFRGYAVLKAILFMLAALPFAACSNNAGGEKGENGGTVFTLDKRIVTKEKGQSFTYKLVTAGSGKYKAESETPGIITLDTASLNERGDVTITCDSAGTTRIKVTDTVSGKTAFSWLIIVKPEKPDYFKESGVYYCITDEIGRKVSVTSHTSPVESTVYTETSLNIPKEVIHKNLTYTVTDIEYPDHWGDTLQSVAVAPDNEFLSSQDGVIFNKNKTVLLWYPCGKLDTSYTVPASVTVLGGYSFHGVSALKSVKLPSGLKRIEDYIFRFCGNIQTLVLPSSLEAVGEYSLYELKVSTMVVPEGIPVLNDLFLGNCSELTSVELPSTLTQIWIYALSSDPKLKTVTCKAANPPTIEESGTVFFVWGKPSSLDSVTLRVPAGSEALYRAAERWKEFGTIVEF